MQDSSYQNLAWATNRLTEAHRTTNLSDQAFEEILQTYLIAQRAYHQDIRDTNERTRQWQPQRTI